MRGGFNIREKIYDLNKPSDLIEATLFVSEELTRIWLCISLALEVESLLRYCYEHYHTS